MLREWTCNTSSCAIGRLLLDGDAPQVAPLQRRGDWSAALQPDLARLSGAEREQCAARWARIAAMEHASIASFSRFILQLLAHGAPPELVEGATRAMQDELRHAQQAFALASAYADVPLGPGPLRCAPPALDAAATLSALIAEACVGEVLGAAEAQAAAARCEDPVIAEVLRGIAHDEAEHAALAWRALGWLLRTYPALQPQAIAALQLAMRPPTIGDEADLSAHGLPGSAWRTRVYTATLTEVVGPCVENLGVSAPTSRPAG